MRACCCCVLKLCVCVVLVSGAERRVALACAVAARLLLSNCLSARVLLCVLAAALACLICLRQLPDNRNLLEAQGRWDALSVTTQRSTQHTKHLPSATSSCSHG